VFFAFVLDAFSRIGVGWQLARHMRTTIVLDALRMALGQRGTGADVELLVHHSSRGSQYTSIDYTQALTDHGGLASVGSIGERLRQRARGVFRRLVKTRLITDRVWRTYSHLELGTVEWVDWFNHYRLARVAR